MDEKRRKSKTNKDKITPQSIPFCKKNRELCYRCDNCEATYLHLPTGQEVFYKCGCSF